MLRIKLLKILMAIIKHGRMSRPFGEPAVYPASYPRQDWLTAKA